MAQKRNLNVNPYFDDFDRDKNFYKVLFKPGFPVQARELTTLQSVLQNQLEQFGNNIFKDGSMVIPGGVTFDPQFYAVKLDAVNSGVDVSVYIKEYIGKTITGLESGITAQVKYVALPGDPNIDDLTIYVKYLSSGGDNVVSQFLDGEALSSNENVVYGNTTINAGTTFASLLNSNATSIGSAVSIANGVYFIRGYFVNVSKQTLLLDEYSNTPSYRVGLKVDELLLSAKDDSSLYDNAKGFSNFASPGADRLQINLSLTKKSLDDLNDTDFVELLRIDNGTIKKIQEKSNYNIIRDYLAERTYEESGNYSIEPFLPSLHNSLNDKISNDGLYTSSQQTEQFNTPSDDLLCVKVSPGKAYVKGYDVENVSTTILDVEKPRDSEGVSSISVPFSPGNVLRVNNVSGSPQQSDVISLHSHHGGTGAGVGSARVYTFNVTDASYQNESTKWDLYLYDVQTFTKIKLNESIDSTNLPKSSYIKGKNSGAYGYTTSAGIDGSGYVVLNQVFGKFVKGEQIILNGVDYPRSITEVVSYGIEDIKSVKNSGSGAYAFSADSFLESFPLPNGVVEGTINSTTLQSPGNIFTGIKTDTIIRYQTGSGLERFNRVKSVSSDGLSLTLESPADVSNVFSGIIDTGTFSNIKIGAPILRGDNNGALYEVLPDKNISGLKLTNANLKIRLQSTSNVQSVGSALTIGTGDFDLTGISTANFVAFDADNYSLHATTNGITTAITSDTFTKNSDNTITFTGVNNTLNYRLNATFTKPGIDSKRKTYSRSTELSVSLSRNQESGTDVNTSINDGLTYNSYYGLRVQDEEISLNYPDVSKVIAIYESLDSSAPTLDTIKCLSTSNIDQGAIVGENISSKTSNTVARYVKSTEEDKAQIVYLNSGRFRQGEQIVFEESNIQTTITEVIAGNYKNITDNFSLDKGQRDQYYDYSRLVRNLNSPIPSKKLLVIFDHYTVSSTDVGDLYTIESYDDERYSEDIPEIGVNRIRATDTLDFRPRVSVFSSTTKSPFDFDSRVFEGSVKTLAPNEDSTIGYDYYLGRVDKLVIDKLGVLSVIKGSSSRTPKTPDISSDAMEIASIELPPYLYNPDDAKISLVDNRRYTMRDIGLIEDRVENLEEVTSLSLLELNTQTLQIRDANNKDRFKSGFFVDDFRNTSRINLDNSTISVDSDKKELTPFISRTSVKGSIGLANNQNKNPDSIDFGDSDLNLLDSNIKKTGDVVTLNYEETEWIRQGIGSTIENVNPFHVVAYNGDVQLSPESDIWVDVQRSSAGQSFGGTNVVGGGRGVIGVFSSSRSFTQDILQSRTNIRYMRSRNTSFSAKNLKPNTRYYQFLSGQGDVDIIPKLLEIQNVSGEFVPGKTVVGYQYDDDGNSFERIRFRIAKSNHKVGNHLTPSEVYYFNPYDYPENNVLPSRYNTNSTVLNIDLESLSQDAQGAFYGYLEEGMQLVQEDASGQTASATVGNLRLVTDAWGDVQGAFFIRNPNVPGNKKIETGNTTYRLTSSSINRTPLPNELTISSAQTTYTVRGTLERRLLLTTTISTTTIVTGYSDPLAQSFTVGADIDAPSAIGRNDDDKGIFLTSVDLFFATVDPENTPIKVEVRTMELGTPTRRVIGKPAFISPKKYVQDETGNVIEQEVIFTSDTGDKATNVKFPEPIYLAPGAEYCIVVISQYSDQYHLWVGEMGQKSKSQNTLPDADSAVYSKQYAFGSLFKSQNGSIWTPDQTQDLKFTLHKAKFTSTSGTAFFYNSPINISNTNSPKLPNNPIKTLPKTARIGINTVLESDSNKDTVLGILTTGQKLAGTTPNSIAYIVGTGSSAATIGIETGGINYGTSSSTNVSTYNIIGQGKNLTLNFGSSQVNSDGVITTLPTINNPGNGYKVGDVVGIVTSEMTDRSGRDARIKISSISGLDTLYLSGVQGSFGSDQNLNAFRSGAGIGVSYYANDGSIVSMANTYITDVTNASSGINTGNYIRVTQFDHGMFDSRNKLKLDNIKPNTIPTKLSSNLDSDATNISVASTIGFDTFEGMPVGTANTGYVKIGREIIGYKEVESNNVLSNLVRGVDNTSTITHRIGDDNGNAINIPVYKYELSGISLRRINNVEFNIDTFDIDSDNYYLSVDRSSNGKDRSFDSGDYPQLSFDQESLVGGNNVTGSRNIIFSEIIPNYPLISPDSSTSVNASIRTVTGTSIGGNEVSFVDNGFESVELNQINRLSSLRMVCSEINESEHLSNLPSNKSLTTAIQLSTTDENLSPAIYLIDGAGTILLNPNINNPVSDYASDDRIKSTNFDPHTSIYVSNTVNLKNPASSLKVIVSAHRPESSDFRVLYKLIKTNSSEEGEYELFPGYDNLKYEKDQLLTVVDSSKNSGRPDLFVRDSLDDEFLEYQFTANNLDLFVGYSIKIVMSSTNNAKYPRFKDLRTIALR